ncbi:hypothetical protein GCM10010495_11450 [Kitasatospora herbaricolor]|uniref:hypothetical protein n=1 Tax=Kitasatospora herbaricolor TaxID=68217 RepID=UPI00174B1840|nr:hypothetical protein [Kitasatospora herbaricolor]MDQ0309418.1 hypothetical protein [Kitasatospora herbaricolor]GGV01938.1 hypothetical protein GCM10010495_11450 [Kitasatospora herbaricolor]
MAKKEPRSYLDPREMGADNLGDAARVFLLCARAARAESRGKSTKRLEARMDRIQKQAQERWDAKHGDQD